MFKRNARKLSLVACILLVAAIISARIREARRDAMFRDAVQSGDAKTVGLLLQRGIDPNAMITEYSGCGCVVLDTVPALLVAAAQGQTEVVRSLIKAGAKVDALDADGWTALNRATEGEHFVTARVLKRLGASE